MTVCKVAWDKTDKMSIDLENFSTEKGFIVSGMTLASLVLQLTTNTVNKLRKDFFTV